MLKRQEDKTFKRQETQTEEKTEEKHWKKRKQNVKWEKVKQQQ